jgi:tetratricopeptide (TPR) repeat protein
MVAHVLEGSVRRLGNHLRITAQLVRADNGYHMWSETYDRDLQDVFKVQDDIANAVVQALQITLMGGPLTRQKGGTQNLEAYQLYLRATSAELQNTQKSLEAERTYLEQAVGLDPTFGLAWSRMASNAMLETEHAILSPPEGFERARQLAQRALQLSPDLSEPHSVLSYVHRIYDWDWVAAATESRRALELDPTNIQGFVIAGIIAYTLGHWDDAERHLRMALAHDPLNTYVLLNLGVTLYGAGRYADADSMYRRLLYVAPGFSWTHMYLGKTLLAEGKPDAALAIVQQDTDEEDRIEILPIVLQAAGQKAEADEALKSLIDKFANVSAYYVAMTYAYRGDPDLALQWLERAYKQKDPSLVEIVGEPLFSNITHDPRYKAFLRKMNLPE